MKFKFEPHQGEKYHVAFWSEPDDSICIVFTLKEAAEFQKELAKGIAYKIADNKK